VLNLRWETARLRCLVYNVYNATCNTGTAGQQLGYNIKQASSKRVICALVLSAIILFQAVPAQNSYAFISNQQSSSFLGASDLSKLFGAALNAPEGVAVDSSGNFWVSDSLNNRIVMYPSPTAASQGIASTVVLGQPDLTSNTANNGGISAYTLSDPFGLAFDSSGNLWVADAGNNRILMYPQANLATGGAATVELGQTAAHGFTTGNVNDGTLSANSLNGPFGLAFDSSGNLWVSDNSNNRVLMYPQGSLTTNGAAATVELGQTAAHGFTTKNVNDGGLSANSLRGPVGLAFNSGNLWVADYSNNRVLMYPPANLATGGAATVVLGQPNFGTSTSGTTATTLLAPFGLAFDSSGNLWVSDSANNRVLKYPPASLVTGGAGATVVLGQLSLMTGTANQGGLSATSLNSPQGIAFGLTGVLIVADGSNNRVLMYPPTTFVNGAAATVVLGQSSSFTTNTVNAGGLSASSLNNAKGIAFDPSGNLWAADQDNNRILEFPAANLVSGSLNFGVATVVLGQSSSFTTNTVNAGGLSASSLNQPLGITFDSFGNLWVAEEDNNRILEFPAANLVSGSLNFGVATVVLGQTGFTTNTPGTTQSTLNEPSFLKFSSGNLWVTDGGNDRILEYTPPFTNGELASVVLGQPDFVTHTIVNPPTATSLSSPQDLGFDSSGNLWTADGENNRILEFPAANLVSGSLNFGVATVVLGQSSSFTTNTVNAGGLSASSLNSPLGIKFDSFGNLWAADEANNRILMYPQANLVTGGAATVELGQTGFTTNTASTTQNTLASPQGLAFDLAGNLWASDEDNNRVLKYPKSFTTGATAAGSLGQPNFLQSGSSGTGPSAISLKTPKGIVFGASGGLNIADSDNNRVLVFPPPPLSPGSAATVALGQLSLTANKVNQGGDPAASGSLNGPGGLAFDSSGNLWVADSANNRVLKYPPANLVTNGHATVALGQPDMSSNTANNGGISATTLNGPVGLAFDSSGNLWVADTSNNRVLKYPPASLATHGAATVELGQTAADGFTTNNVNDGGLSANSLNNPVGLAFDSSGNLWVADQTNNRVLEYQKPGGGFTSSNNGMAATVVLGQPDFFSSAANQGSITSSETTLSTPTALSFDSSGNLWVADTSNNRVLKYPPANLATGGAATVEFGQPDLLSNTANNGGVSATTLNGPVGLAFDLLGNLWVSDTSNNLVKTYLNLPSASVQKTNSIISGANDFIIGNMHVKFNAPFAFGTSTLNTEQTPTDPESSSPPGFAVGNFFHFDTTSGGILSSRQVVLTYDPSTLGNIKPSTLVVERFSSNSWTAITSTIDTTAHTVTATPPGFSTFVLVGTAAAQTVGGSAPGAPPSFSTGFAQNEYPFKINSNPYKLPNYTNTGPLSTIPVGSPFTIKVMLYGDVDPSSVKHVSLFTNIRGNYASLAISDTILSWDAAQPLQISDPNHFFGPVTTNATVQGNKLQVTFNGTFAKPMLPSDIGIRTWGYDLYSQDVYLINAWQATSVQTLGSNVGTTNTKIINTNPSTATQTNISNIPNSTTSANTLANDLVTTVKEWAGYNPTAISDSQMLQSMGYQGTHIPTWVMKSMAKYLVDGSITQGDFAGAIKYLADNHIIK